MKTQKISVVIPTFKRLNLLSNCLNALKNQTLEKENFEVIVVSDGPDLETENAINFHAHNYPFKLIYLHTEIKKGPAAARNLGWLKANSELIAFTDDDCLPEKDWLEKMLEFYNGQKLIVYSGRIIVPLEENPTDFALNTSRLEVAEFVTANCACSKQALIKVGGFDEQFSLAWREDSDLAFRFIESRIPIYHNHLAVVVHPVREAPWGVSLKEQRKGMFDVLLFKKNPMLFESKIGKNILWNYYLIVFLCLLACFGGLLKFKSLYKISTLLMAIPVSSFTYKRLKNTSKAPVHVAEMVITSLIIPFLSIYWRVYGMLKFKKILF